MMTARRERGAILLEALIALAVLGTVASGGAWLASESLRAVSRAYEAERRVRDAANFLTAVSLWPREDLDRHLGASEQGPWRLRIGRPRPTLYSVSLTDSVTRMVVLRTALFREDRDR